MIGAGVFLECDEGDSPVETSVDAVDKAADLPEVLVELEEINDVQIVRAP